MTVTALKGTHKAPRSSPPRMDTLLVKLETLYEWVIPPFQRPLTVNPKVRALSEEIKHNGGVLPGILTLGMIGEEKTVYLIDGQHRTEAAKISALAEFMCDVRIITFQSMADMGSEFVDLNSHLVRMRPDDILRGLEGTLPALQFIKSNCEFVGYNIRRSKVSASSVLSMSQALRCWQASQSEVPRTGGSASDIANNIPMSSAQQLVVCLQTCRSAWGEDPENYKLWGELNLSLTMWMWRRLVLDKDRSIKRYAVLYPEQFRRCLMQVSADHNYIDWLVGRGMNEKNLSPCYTRLKICFVARLKEEPNFGAPKMPMPSWAST